MNVVTWSRREAADRVVDTVQLLDQRARAMAGNDSVVQSKELQAPIESGSGLLDPLWQLILQRTFEESLASRGEGDMA